MVNKFRASCGVLLSMALNYLNILEEKRFKLVKSFVWVVRYLVEEELTIFNAKLIQIRRKIIWSSFGKIFAGKKNTESQ